MNPLQKAVFEAAVIASLSLSVCLVLGVAFWLYPNGVPPKRGST